MTNYMREPKTLYDSCLLFAGASFMILFGAACLSGAVAVVVWVGKWIGGL